MMKLKYPLIAIAITLISIGVMASNNARQTPSIQVPQSTDLASLSQDASNRKLPVLLVFSAEDCPYCQLLEDEILKPMLLSGDYNDKVLINKIMLDDDVDIRDFNGDAVNADILSQRYGIYVTPTMLFLDANGRELNERLLGINTIEMFGGRVDQAIEASLDKLRIDSQHVATRQPIATTK